MNYQHLIGLKFDIEKRNCYQLLRDFYRDIYGIELSDYSCPTDWWRTEIDLFGMLAADEGFSIVTAPPVEWKPGDVILMAIDSTHGNHCAVLVEGGKILHHLVGQMSAVTSYGGLFRNHTVGVYRHKQVPQDQPLPTVDLSEILPPHVRRRVAQQTPTGS